jgi:predicted alpha/beta hydrolase family esterase
MIQYFIVPGIGNSGPEHWQTYFEKSGTNFNRIIQQEWNAPVCKDWIETIDKTISPVELSSVILIGHSLGCSAIAHWATHYNRKIRGALLVAPSDPEAPHYNFPITGFNPVPRNRIDFKTIIVTSSNDQWVTLDRAKYFADKWGSELINIGDAGHINVASGHGEWKQGLEILKRLG